MNNGYFNKLYLLPILLMGPFQAGFAACDQTLSPGANVASAISIAASGSTICLNNGDYGSLNLSGINKSNYVTVQSASGRGATISPQIDNSKYLQFNNLTINGSTISYCAANIKLTNSTFTSGLLITMRSASCSYPLNITVDGNVFSNLRGALYEGRISVADDDGPQASMGVVISNNEIRDGCQSDGVQIVGGASGVQIGPGNVFSNIIQSGSVHCDNIQFYGSGQNNNIIKNTFKNGSSFLMLVDSDDNGIIKDNVFDGTGDGAGYKLQIAQTTNTVFEHNTLKNAGLSLNGPTTAAVRNNIFLSSNYTQADPSGNVGPCTNCTVSNNLFSGSPSGSGAITGTPTFIGGSSPSTWAGWQLASGSPGYHAASDGLDMGTTFYGAGTGTISLASPKNLRMN